MSKELLIECRNQLQQLNGLVVKSEGVDCKFDELLAELDKEIYKENLSIDDYYREWERNIELIDKWAHDLMFTKEQYSNREQEILNNTDFKELYGANNQKIRDNHVKKELKNIVDTKNSLELGIDNLKRRNDLIKSMMAMQRALIEAGVFDE